MTGSARDRVPTVRALSALELSLPRRSASMVEAEAIGNEAKAHEVFAINYRQLRDARADLAVLMRVQDEQGEQWLMRGGILAALDEAAAAHQGATPPSIPKLTPSLRTSTRLSTGKTSTPCARAVEPRANALVLWSSAKTAAAQPRPMRRPFTGPRADRPARPG